MIFLCHHYSPSAKFHCDGIATRFFAGMYDWSPSEAVAVCNICFSKIHYSKHKGFEITEEQYIVYKILK